MFAILFHYFGYEGQNTFWVVIKIQITSNFQLSTDDLLKDKIC